MRRRSILLPAAALAAGVALLGGALAGSPSAGRELPPTADAAAGRLLEGFAAGDTAAYLVSLEERVRANPADAEGLTLLGLAYQQRARERGDPSFYPRAERALRRALRLDGRNDLALTGLAALAASRHRFDEARAYARRSLRLNPHRAATYGILGDANVELGRYREAFTAFERAVSLKPSASAYARVSYARELLGRTEPAISAMRLAVRAAGAGEPAAWSLVNLGNLYLETGRLAPAERAYREALARLPGYAPGLAALGRLESWRGRPGAALALYRRALEAQPLPEYAVGLGDVHAAEGRTAAAEDAYRSAEALEADFARNGGRNGLETALFDLDHDRHLVDALARAREARNLRPSVEGEHVLAWALYKNGHCLEARRHSVRALRLGTKDWGAMLHRSLIERCLGSEAAADGFRARALHVNAYALIAFGQPVP